MSCFKRYLLLLLCFLLVMPGGHSYACAENVEICSGEVLVGAAPGKLCAVSDTVAVQSVTYFSNIAEAGNEMRRCLKSRTSSFTLNIKGMAHYDNMEKDIFAYAVAHTGVPTEGDYLTCHIGSYSFTSSWNSAGEIKIVFTVTYYTDNIEEKNTDTAVSAMLSSLSLTGMNDRDKIRAVYDKVCGSVKYDYVHLNDPGYTAKYTAYSAAVKGTAVCQGYSALLYRMLLSAGVDARCISGKGNGENHMWNIVRLEDRYYNLDATWDSANSEFEYFLSGSTDFPLHTRSREFNTAAFNSAYPMAETRYTAPSEGTVYKPGDVDNNGKVNSLDYNKVKRHALGLFVLEGPAFAAGDINGDGRINAVDYNKIKRHALKMLTLW